MSRSQMVRLGRFMFPLRGHLGVPFLVLALRLCSPLTEPPVWLGWQLLLVGLSLRLWGVAGWVPSRLGGEQPERLITEDGPYAFSRNPRYLGNLLMGIGGCSLAGLPQCLGPYLLLWAGLHLPIVAFEESLLEDRWGADYRNYCLRVPRFLGWPRRPLGPQVCGLRWGQAFCLEMTTIAGWLSLGCFLQAWRGVSQGGSTLLLYLAVLASGLLWTLLSALRSQLRRSK